MLLTVISVGLAADGLGGRGSERVGGTGFVGVRLVGVGDGGQGGDGSTSSGTLAVP